MMNILCCNQSFSHLQIGNFFVTCHAYKRSPVLGLRNEYYIGFVTRKRKQLFTNWENCIWVLSSPVDAVDTWVYAKFRERNWCFAFSQLENWFRQYSGLLEEKGLFLTEHKSNILECCHGILHRSESDEWQFIQVHSLFPEVSFQLQCNHKPICQWQCGISCLSPDSLCGVSTFDLCPWK